MRPAAKFRRDHGITQRMLASVLDCAPSTISRYERGVVKRPARPDLNPSSMRSTVTRLVEARGDHIQLDLEDFTGEARAC